MGFYRVTYQDGAFTARVRASSPESALNAVFNKLFPPPIYETDSRVLKQNGAEIFQDYGFSNDPNTWKRKFTVEDELRLLDAEIDSQVFGNEVMREAPEKPIRTTDHTPVPRYSTNEADAEKALSHAMKQLCKNRPRDFVGLCQNGPEITTEQNLWEVGLYELETVTASTKAHALCLAALKTVSDISQFIS